jgi:hypothetical protein
MEKSAAFHFGQGLLDYFKSQEGIKPPNVALMSDKSFRELCATLFNLRGEAYDEEVAKAEIEKVFGLSIIFAMVPEVVFLYNPKGE